MDEEYIEFVVGLHVLGSKVFHHNSLNFYQVGIPETILKRNINKVGCPGPYQGTHNLFLKYVFFGLYLKKGYAMAPYSSKNDWTWNCGPKNDIDVRATWGDNGRLTLHLYHLRSLTYVMDVWNERDNTWRHKTATQMLSQPTSDPVTFHGVAHTDHYSQANTLWGKKYKIYSTLIIYSGASGGALRMESFETRVEGCFRGDDPNYTGLEGCATPPIVPCN